MLCKRKSTSSKWVAVACNIIRPSNRLLADYSALHLYIRQYVYLVKSEGLTVNVHNHKSKRQEF